MTVRDRIVNKAVELLEQEPSGIRFSVLVKKLEAELPDIKPKNIPAILVILERKALSDQKNLKEIEDELFT